MQKENNYTLKHIISIKTIIYMQKHIGILLKRQQPRSRFFQWPLLSDRLG